MNWGDGRGKEEEGIARSSCLYVKQKEELCDCEGSRCPSWAVSLGKKLQV